jgi:NAD(P)-dependent dehydrogenase (short-subunit alcohol dehydrogenase family)
LEHLCYNGCRFAGALSLRFPAISSLEFRQITGEISMDMGLEGKVAIITGGSDGIGKAAALSMVKEGANVVIVARRQDVLDQAVNEIKTATEGSVVPLALDVTSDGASKKMIKTAIDNFGRVDIIVNNAGTSMAKPFEDVSHDDWQSDFELKVWAAVRLMQDSIVEMRKVGGGRIINVTNLGGRTPGPASMPTSISRAAGIAITKGLSKDLAKENILVTTVCIGLIKSGQHQRRYDARLEKEPNLSLETFYDELAAGRNVPIGRVGEPEEAGDVIAFLASERASYLTGIAVNLDGGASSVV